MLRHFGVKKELARERFGQFVMAGLKHGHRDEFYRAEEGRILGSEEFVDATIHRIGETRRAPQGSKQRLSKRTRAFYVTALLAAVEKSCWIAKEKFCGPGKSADLINAKEALILIGRQAGDGVKELPPSYRTTCPGSCG